MAIPANGAGTGREWPSKPGELVCPPLQRWTRKLLLRGPAIKARPIKHAEELYGQISEAELARQIAAVEENELRVQGRAGRYYACWIRGPMNSPSGMPPKAPREAVCRTAGTAGRVQLLTRNVPKNGAALAEEFLKLDAERVALNRAEEQQRRIELLRLPEASCLRRLPICLCARTRS